MEVHSVIVVPKLLVLSSTSRLPLAPLLSPENHEKDKAFYAVLA